MATRLQQVLVDVPISRLRDGESARSYIHTLSSRCGIASTDLQQQFHELLSGVFASSLGFWICDYVAIVCADASITSSDPEEHTVLQPTGVLAWCQGAAQELQNKVVTLVKSSATSEAQPDQAIDLYHAAKTLLAIAEAVQAALGNRSQPAADLTAKLQLLQQTTGVLQWLEQLQQQRPGQAPLITRTITSASTPTGVRGITPATAAPIEPFGPRTAPSYVSLPAWQQQLKQLRQKHPNGRLFLDDLVDELLRVSESQRAVEYPYKDVLGCVEGLFLSGSSSREAWRAKLSVLLYYLLDGGWLTAAAPLSQGFHLPLTMVQQWQCHYLMDNASSSTSSSTGSSSSSADDKLHEACRLLGAIASPATPFRFVEALLSAGRPSTALAVQRARCAAGGSTVTSLSEAQVLLKVQLGCGLLAEAFSELRKHCSQLPNPQRFTQVQALVQQLAAWATADSQQQQQQQELAMSSRVQQLCQLPLNAEEEAALLGYFREKMAAGQSGGYVVPLYLLQRGRSLEALKAYADYKASPAAAAAASSEQGALLDRQLQTLMSAAAAALPPSLRVTAVSTTAASGSDGAAAVSVLSGLGGLELDISKSSTPVAVLSSQGGEQPVFMSQIVPAAVAGDCGVRWQATAAAGGGAPTAQGEAQQQDAATVSLMASAVAKAAPRFGVVAAAGLDSNRPVTSLFAAEVAAAAGPGSVALSSSHQGAPTGLPAAAADPDYVPLLFGTPAPAAAAAQRLGQPSGGYQQYGFSTPGVGQDSGFGMSEEEFGREVLGLGQGSETVRKVASNAVGGVGGGGVAPAAARDEGMLGSVKRSTRRLSKRARQTPGGFAE